MLMNDIKNFKWHFPPTTTKKGKKIKLFDIKEVIQIKSNLFSNQFPVIIMSDLHSQTLPSLLLLDYYINLDQCIVLTCGDMASERPIFGCDGDPTFFYKYLSTKTKEFYFIQGNHDLPHHDNSQNNIINLQNNYSNIKNGYSIDSLIGKIGGVNGIISDHKHPYKLNSFTYLHHLKNVLKNKIDILMTHDTPYIPNTKGNIDIFNLTQQYKPKIHLFGHCHFNKWYYKINGVHYICADSRILIFIPNNYDKQQLFKKDLEDRYINYTNKNIKNMEKYIKTI